MLMFLPTCAHVILSHEGTWVKLVSTSEERASSHALENLIDIYCMTEPHLSPRFTHMTWILLFFMKIIIVIIKNIIINNNKSNNKNDHHHYCCYI